MACWDIDMHFELKVSCLGVAALYPVCRQLVYEQSTAASKYLSQ
jgi:hypothetical protein